jgi:hypothetical protein
MLLVNSKRKKKIPRGLNDGKCRLGPVMHVTAHWPKRVPDGGC